MTPKDKAEELLERFNLPTGLMSIERKQCALICVDEIIKELDEMERLDRGGVNGCYGQDDWNEVKEEINKMQDMKSRTRITLALQRQIAFGIAYLHKTIWIGILCFNIQIDCTNYKMNLFRFDNNLKL